MPERVTVPFGPWLPDLPDADHPGLVEAKNVYRLNGAYQPQRDIEFPGGDQSDDLGVASASNFISAISAKEGGVEFYALARHDGSKIHLVSIECGSSNSPNSIDTGTAASDVSNFVNFDGDVYYFTRNSEQYKSVRGATFSLVSSSTLFGASAAGRVGSFIMTGFRFNLKWSGFNQPEEWAISQRTQAGEATVSNPEMGFVTGILGGKTNYLFQEFGLSRLEYVGPPTVWRFTPISNRFGCSPQSAVEVGDVTYFLAVDTSYDSQATGSGGLRVVKTNGAAIQDISTGVVADWLSANFLESSAFNHHPAIFDAPRRRIIWASNTGQGSHKYLSMSVDTEEFSYFEGEFNILIPGPYHHEDNGGKLVGVADNGGNLHYGPLTGDTLEATLTKGHLSSAGVRTHLSGVEPIYQGSGVTVAVSSKEKLRDDAAFDVYQTEEAATGIVSKQSQGRSTAISAKYPATSAWSDASGFVAEITVDGKR